MRISSMVVMLLVMLMMGPTGQPVLAIDATPVMPQPVAPNSESEVSGGGAIGVQMVPTHVAIYIAVCETHDPDLVGTSTFGVFARVAETGTTGGNCQWDNPKIAGDLIFVSLQSGDLGPYVASFEAGTGSPIFEFDPLQIQQGNYTVTVSSASGMIGGQIPEPVALGFDGLITGISITAFIAADPNEEPGAGADGMVSGAVYYCPDLARAGITDFFFGEMPLLLECTYIYGDQPNSITFTEVDSDGLIVPGGETGTFPLTTSGGYSGSLAPGIYVVTYDANGATSEPVTVTSNATTSVKIVVRNDMSTQMPTGVAIVNVYNLWCPDPLGSSRPTDYVVNHLGDAFTDILFAQSTTCNPVTVPGAVTVSLESDTYSKQVTFSSPTARLDVVEPGMYTVTRQGAPNSSDPFELEAGDFAVVTIVNYVTPPAGPDDPPGETGTGKIRGMMEYCDSEDKAGQVDFLLSNVTLFDIIFATSTGECQISLASTGAFGLYRYSDAAGTQLISEERISAAYVEFQFGDSTVEPGYYRLGYLPDLFGDPILSDVVTVHAGADIYFIVTIYQHEEDVFPVYINQDICTNPERAFEADIWVEPVDDFAASTTGSGVSAQESSSVSCMTFRDWLAMGGNTAEITYTLTDVATNRQISVDYAEGFTGFITVWPVLFVHVSPGTYTLTMEMSGWPGAVVSAPFDIGAAANGYTAMVRNYIGDPLPVWQQEGERAQLTLLAFTCDAPARGGEYDFIVAPSLLAGAGITGTDVAGAVANVCEPDNTFAFELVPAVEGTDLQAAAPIPLVRVPGSANQYVIETGGEAYNDVLAGMYYLRETTTGSTSDLVDLTAQGSIGRFYLYLPLPPTPTATATATASATATATSTVEATATATSPVEPTGTLTPTSTVTPSPFATGTMKPTGTATIPDRSILPGRTSTPPAAGGAASTGGLAGDGTGVTALPATGQGNAENRTNGMLMLLALSMLLASALLARHQRHR